MSATHAHDQASQLLLDAGLRCHAVVETHEDGADRTEAVLDDRVCRERGRYRYEGNALARAAGQRVQNGAQGLSKSHGEVPVSGQCLGSGNDPPATLQGDRIRIGAARVEPDPELLHRPRNSILRDAASTAFDSTMAIVMGPRPPGTGVIQPARSKARSYSTSPTILPAPSRLMPTSKTAAPGLIQSPGTKCALPTAATTRSARSTSARTSRVPVWQTVTVAPASSSSSAIGRPTMFDAPTTVAFSPRSAMLYSAASRMTPCGVHGRSPGRFCASRPVLTG